MRTIEPCCAPKQFMWLRDVIGNNGKTQFKGYGDLSLAEFLPALLTRYSEADMMIVAPSIPNQAASAICKWMGRRWARMDGKGKIDCISHLTVVADLGEEPSPVASSWLKDNPFGRRLSLYDRKQDNTAILMPDIAITGPMNLQYSEPFVCSVTTIPDEVSALWKEYSKLTGAPEPTPEPAPRRGKRKKAEQTDNGNEKTEK